MSDRFTVFTVTLKFTLPTSTTDEDAQTVADALKLWAHNPNLIEQIDDNLSSHLADMEYTPVLPNDPFDHDSLKIEVE